jgi:hypothetical protein
MRENSHCNLGCDCLPDCGNYPCKGIVSQLGADDDDDDNNDNDDNDDNNNDNDNDNNNDNDMTLPFGCTLLRKRMQDLSFRKA